ncbi:MAG: hypothetical protein U1E52_10585 [Geminicoccaceae bacterium]
MTASLAILGLIAILVVYELLDRRWGATLGGRHPGRDDSRAIARH